MIEWLSEYGIFGLGVVFFLDDVGFPVPSTAILFGSAVLARTHQTFPLIPLFLICVCMVELGNAILFYWGRHGAKKWLQTHGHKFFLPQSQLDKIESFFAKKHGSRTIFLVSMITNVRPFFALIAGSSGMSPWKFFPFNLAGIILWAGGTITAGYFVGEQFLTIVQNYWQPILILFVMVGGGIIARKKLFKGKA